MGVQSLSEWADLPRTMCDRAVLELVSQIRDLYVRQCDYASRIQAVREADDARLIESCRAREHPHLPELQYFTTEYEQRESLQKALADPLISARARRIQTVVWVGIFVACMGIQAYTSSLWVLFGFAGVVGGIFLVAYHQFGWLQAPVRTHIRRQLLERGVPICLDCGYDLRGLTSRRCPECGRLAPDLPAASPME